MSADLARVACVIAARDEEPRIAATVTAARRLPGVDLVVVCDDGSTDRTSAYAGAAGAIVVNHSRTRGKAAAVESAVNALGVLEQRDSRAEAGTLLLLDADLGGSAALAAQLVTPVSGGRADLTIAVPPPGADEGATPGSFDLVTTTATRGIAELTGWTPRAPLSGQRCLTRRAFELASPLAPGWGMEVGMTIDILRAGLRVEEIEIELELPTDTGRDLAGPLHQAALLRDVTRALVARGAVTADSAREAARTGLAGLRDAGSGLFKRLRG